MKPQCSQKQTMSSDQNKIKLGIINNQICINTSNIWELSHTFLNNSQVKGKKS